MTVANTSQEIARHEIKPCPFCGVPGKLGEIIRVDRFVKVGGSYFSDYFNKEEVAPEIKRYFVFCPRCEEDNCEWHPHLSPEDAIARWNRRVSDSAAKIRAQTIEECQRAIANLRLGLGAGGRGACMNTEIANGGIIFDAVRDAFDALLAAPSTNEGGGDDGYGNIP